jgi:hypothetical protein
MVRFQMGQYQQERVLLVLIDIADSRIGDRIHTITGKLLLYSIPIEENRIIRIGDELRRVCPQPELVPPTTLWRDRILVPVEMAEFNSCQMPFTDIPCLIACIAEHRSKGILIRFQGEFVFVYTRPGGIFSSLDTGTRWAANRLTGECVLVEGISGGKPIEVWCKAHGISMNAKGVPALLIGKKDDEVWLSHV